MNDPSSPRPEHALEKERALADTAADTAASTTLPDPQVADIDLGDKYTRTSGRVFLTGIQALVRLPMDQRRRDERLGYNTAGYVSGYRGSPLGGMDHQFNGAKEHLDRHHVVFHPAVNEDLAATACWGTQQAELDGEGLYDGVFCLWYGKGPGVDRTGDVFRHANFAGTSKRGGVVALLGDDHASDSSTTAHHSEYAMVDASIPVLNPAGVQEILDYGLVAIALSRYSGCWVSLKCVHDTVEAAASVDVDPDRLPIVFPALADPSIPADAPADDPENPGLGIRWPDTPLEQERRMYAEKLEAVRAFCRANHLDKTIVDSPDARLGIVTTGKSFLDVQQALEDLGIDEATAKSLGIRHYKVALTFPLEPQGAKRFAEGLDAIVVVEEKRALVESQLKEILYGEPNAPGIVGKRNEQGQDLFSPVGRLDSNHIAAELGRRILEIGLAGRADRAPGDSPASLTERLRVRVEYLQSLISLEASLPTTMERMPYFCAGCPHNSSTHVPEGSRALSGIGCHYLAQFMDRSTARYTQMGGEGSSWIGQSRFSKRKHVFQNIGDGTYFHSGLLSIRAAVAAGTDITFKILYNDAVAMTGGQAVDGPISPAIITRQMHSEGVQRIAVVTDQPEKYGSGAGFAPGTKVWHRRDLDTLQREFREIPGTTVIVYDQTCAAEKRRRRKRGKFPDPAMRAFINEAVCEGCGDCGIKSNCVAVVPAETEFGRKRAIDQSSCNKDFSCVEGFCPSFVTVHGGRLRKAASATPSMVIPEPDLPPLERPCQIIITGVGGTGVLTIGALLGMAAHLESKGCSILDQTGLAQKGGAVVSHVRIAASPSDISATRVASGSADLVIGCDMVVTADPRTRSTICKGSTLVVVNTHQTMTGAFTRDVDLLFPSLALMRDIEGSAGPECTKQVQATNLATALCGDAIAANMFMLGYAWQQGRIPLSRAAIVRAIELNGVAVQMNTGAFEWGRCAAADIDAVARLANKAKGVVEIPAPKDEETLIERRAAYLEQYQNRALADRYLAMIEGVRQAERTRAKGMRGLTEAVAKGYFKLLAYKDEYEVARLHSSTEFRRRLEATFDGDYSLAFHLAPPLIARRDPTTGEPRKMRFGPWMMKAFTLLAKFKGLRGTPFDPFGYTSERRLERTLITRYEEVLTEVLQGLDHENHAMAIEIASLPERIRGFGHIKQKSITEAQARETELLRRFHSPSMTTDAA
ncbi:indolepyruvate ferredoxin oxidoreductase family protein [Thioalkalivibrio sp. HK1]|uniref:indolepyruvate ferredoxin oxidoreductase family protein n=1 Tax=Thioalkalivibrio sp. HK1 TaxID=1469245 RepID=UPI00046E9B86|nr:indolepyruvate ferredoxin oxidoreductase family protein [Thioalkalivibrio sp. HK1]